MKKRIRIMSIVTMLFTMLLGGNAFAATTTNSVFSKADQYVTIAEQYMSGVGTVAAAQEIAKLPISQEKDLLAGRLQKVNDYIYDQKVVTATNAVIIAERMNNATQATYALGSIAVLKEGDLKDSLIQRVYNLTTNEPLAIKQVGYAETAKDITSVKRARMYVNGLKEPVNTFSRSIQASTKQQLLQRLDNIKIKG